MVGCGFASILNRFRHSSLVCVWGPCAKFRLLFLCGRINCSVHSFECNVLVFKQLDTVLVNAGGYFGGQGEPVCCNLASKRECEARAHFESLVGERQLIDFMCSFSFKRRRLRKKSLRPCNGVSAICRHMMATLTRWDMVQLQGCRFETSLDFDAVVVFLGLLLMAFSWICQG